MPCDSPLKGFRSLEKHEGTGKPVITFNPLKAINSTNPITIPCGQCIGCKLEKARQWAVRMEHESQLYEANNFLTLTYDKKNLPADYSVDLKTWQDFMKRYRKSIEPRLIRFYMCGEYGSKNFRPHYHAIIFGHDFEDKVHVETNERGDKLYSSKSLEKLWDKGRAILGDVTFESCGYVARYVTTKQTGETAGAFYLRQNPDTGFWHQVEPEFSTQSRKPGLGAPWLTRFKTDVYPSDEVVSRGRTMKPPRFYDTKLTEEELDELKRRRKAASIKYKPNNTPERLKVRATVRNARISQLKRKL